MTQATLNLIIAEARWSAETNKVVFDYTEHHVEPRQTHMREADNPIQYFEVINRNGDHYRRSWPSSFLAGLDMYSTVIIDKDTGKVFGSVASLYKNSFGVKNAQQWVEYTSWVRANDGWDHGSLDYMMDRVEKFFIQGFIPEEHCTSPYDQMKLVWCMHPEFHPGGVKFYASWRDHMRKRKSETTFGRFIRKVFPKATDAQVEEFVNYMSKVFVKREFTLHEGASRANFKLAYGGKRADTMNIRTTQSRKSLANSCMRDKDWGFGSLHPAEVYASGSFKIFWLEDKQGHIAGRVNVYFPEGKAPQAGPCYGVCEASLNLLEAKLDEIGAVRYDNAEWWGAKLLKIEINSGEYLMPYLDLCAEAEEHDDCFILDKSGDFELVSTDGYLNTGDRHECYECGCRMHSDDVYTAPYGWEEYCESCYHDNFVTCDMTGEIYRSDDVTSANTNQRRHLWGAGRCIEITVGPDVEIADCHYTDELWVVDDMVDDVDGNLTSPIYAADNLTQVKGVWYTSQQLADNGLDEDGDEIVTEQEGEAA